MAEVSLTLLVLRTRQLEALRAFYQALGIELSAEKHGEGPLHYAGRVGETVLELYPPAGESGTVDSATRLGFAVDNLTETVRALRERGTPVVRDPEPTAWGLRAVVRDPDGRSVELREKPPENR
jgi:catechol 2,3-dioxygenase-like lactoylglutathione lyase family enzyme